MAIEYSKVGWAETPYKYANPTNMDKMDTGIKNAVDGVNALEYVPSALEEIKVLGWSTPTAMSVRNYVDSNRQLHVKVGRVEFTELIWNYSPDTSPIFYSTSLSGKSKVGGIVYTDLYRTLDTHTPHRSGVDHAIQTYEFENYTYIYDSTYYNNVSNLLAHLKGHYLYYELATEYVIPLDGSEVVNDQECLKYLGWTVPKALSVKNVAKNGGGLIQRVGRVDMGTLSWNYNIQYEYFYTTISDKEKNSVGWCNEYNNIGSVSASDMATAPNMSMALINNRIEIRLKNTAFTDATAFRTSLNGTYLYYELASPVEWTEGSEQIVENTTDIASLMTQVNELIKGYDGAGYHNGVYRGKSLGSSVTSAQYSEISSGRFRDLYIGDYWTIGGVNYRIAGFDYYLNCGDTSCTTHHVAIVPDTFLYNQAMNDTNVTTGGYVGSKMYTEGLERAKTIINAAFSGHVLNHRVYLTNATSNGKPSAGAWCESEVDLMCEEMVYGCGIFRPTSDGSNVPVNHRVEKSQLPLFQFRADLISNSVTYWLRDVATAANFALVNNGGFANYAAANFALGVRPSFCIKG